MKTLYAVLVTFAIAGLTSCNNSQPENKVEAVEPAASTGQTAAATGSNFVLQKDQSSVQWKGANKFTPKNHAGVLQLSDGSFTVANNQITGGGFTADMNSISTGGDEYTNGLEKVGDLIGHLKSADFFDVANFPTASFAITSVQPKEGDPNYSHNVTGNLTIKGITKEVTFPAKIELNGSDLKGSTVFTIDRSQWEVRYGSESFFPDLVKDRLIKNEIELTLNLVAKAA